METTALSPAQNPLPSEAYQQPAGRGLEKHENCCTQCQPAQPCLTSRGQLRRPQPQIHTVACPPRTQEQQHCPAHPVRDTPPCPSLAPHQYITGFSRPARHGTPQHAAQHSWRVQQIAAAAVAARGLLAGWLAGPKHAVLSKNAKAAAVLAAPTSKAGRLAGCLARWGFRTVASPSSCAGRPCP